MYQVIEAGYGIPIGGLGAGGDDHRLVRLRSYRLYVGEGTVGVAGYQQGQGKENV